MTDHCFPLVNAPKDYTTFLLTGLSIWVSKKVLVIGHGFSVTISGIKRSKIVSLRFLTAAQSITMFVLALVIPEPRFCYICKGWLVLLESPLPFGINIGHFIR